MKINRIRPDSHKYLKVLTSIAKSPDILHYIGNLPTDRVPTVAIVGSRKPTAYGREVTQKFAYELARRGVVIVSGLALGVDGIAHRSAVEAGGTTIAILANGLPTIYPAAHKHLAHDIITSGGALLSEYEPHSSARPYQFLERNRLVSGIADAVIITEAAARSGTLNTAMHALEQGKEVLAVPGNITSPMSSGTNALIKQGATPLTDPSDIFEVIMPNLIGGHRTLPLGNNQLETQIIALLHLGVRDGDALQRQVSVDAATFSTTLTMMELAGIIRSLGANQWTLR